MSDFFFHFGAPHTSLLIWSLTFWSEQEWLFCRMRSGFGSECYVTWYMGQNNSITYEIAVQMGVTMVKGRLMQTAALSVFSGCGSVLITDRHAPESSLSLFLLALFHFSPSPSVCSLLFLAHSHRHHCHILMLLLPRLVSLWRTGRQPARQIERQINLSDR